MLLAQAATFANFFAWDSEGINMDTNNEIMAITTNNSISVKPCFRHSDLLAYAGPLIFHVAILSRSRT